MRIDVIFGGKNLFLKNVKQLAINSFAQTEDSLVLLKKCWVDKQKIG